VCNRAGALTPWPFWYRDLKKRPENRRKVPAVRKSLRPLSTLVTYSALPLNSRGGGHKEEGRAIRKPKDI
jgi:hypothetical protein